MAYHLTCDTQKNSGNVEAHCCSRKVGRHVPKQCGPLMSNPTHNDSTPGGKTNQMTSQNHTRPPSLWQTLYSTTGHEGFAPKCFLSVRSISCDPCHVIDVKMETPTDRRARNDWAGFVFTTAVKIFNLCSPSVVIKPRCVFSERDWRATRLPMFISL